MKSFYLPGLFGIRAIACVMVFCEHYSFHFGVKGLAGNKFNNLGTDGVVCFFTLSGFLITLLLLREKDSHLKIDIRQFYYRRILRIWPVYFLVMLIGALYFCFSPLKSEKPAYFLFFLFFAGHLAFSLVKSIWIINPLWSVGVEEQFYAFWPWLIRGRRVFRAMVLFILGWLLLRLVFKSEKTVYNFLSATRLDCMAIGGIFSYLYFTKAPVLKFLFRKSVQVFAWTLFIFSFFHRIHVYSFIDQELYSLLIGIILLNISVNPKTILSVENNILKYIGKISYGIYAYHMPVLFIFTMFFPPAVVRQVPLWNLFLPIVLLFVVIAIAHLSFFLFEVRFLSIRKKIAGWRSLSPNV